MITAILAVRVGGLLLVDGVLERGWRRPPSALVRLLVHIGLAVSASAFILKNAFDVDVATLFTTSAVLAAVLGFAMQSTLAALFAGVAMQLERHFRPGDGIVIAGEFAVVETLGWRSMTARRPDGSLIMVPNEVAVSEAVVIRRPGELTKTSLTVAAPMSVPPALAAEILREILWHLPGLAEDTAVSVDVLALRPEVGLVDLDLTFWSRPGDPEEAPLSATVLQRTWYAYQRHGVVLPRTWTVTDPDISEKRWSLVYGSPLPERLVAAFRTVDAWRGMDGAALARLAASGRRLLYAPGEPIVLPLGAEDWLALVVCGTVASLATEPAGASPRPVLSLGRWDAAALLRVEAELAGFIGPYARRATRRAAAEATDLAALYASLAAHIDNQDDRAGFLTGAPGYAIRVLAAGATFSPASSGRGPQAGPPRFAAIESVEIFAIPPGGTGA